MILQKIKCPKCGRIMSCTSDKSVHGNQKYNYYVCMCEKPRTNISESQLEIKFIQEFNQMLDIFMTSPIAYLPVKSNVQPADEETMLINQRQKLEEKIDKVNELYIENKYTKDKVDAKLDEINIDLKKVDEGLELVRRQDVRIKETFDITKYAYNIQNEKLREISYAVKVENLWNELTNESKQELIMEFIDSVEVKVYLGANAFAPKPIEITNIIIRSDKIPSIAFDFRKRILELANKEDIDINKYLETKEYQNIQEGLKISPFFDGEIDKGGDAT